MTLADLLDATDHLKLGFLIDYISMINPILLCTNPLDIPCRYESSLAFPLVVFYAVR